MRQILMDNALEAWKSAISYADDIISGKSTLKYRKNFIASLHNATELFIKQLMLDTGNHEVCKKISIKRDPGGMLQAAFDAATDLNEFFFKLPQADVEKYRSADYKDICQKTTCLFDTYYAEYPQDRTIVNDALKLLKELRNNETHFFIDKWTFLIESEFVQLYNFMIVFYRILHKYNLLPFWGEAITEYAELDFSKQPLVSFSYKDALLKSNELRIIAEVMAGVQLPYVNDSSFEISKMIVEYGSETYWAGRFDELWAYVETAIHYGLITVETQFEEFDEPGIRRGTSCYCCLYVQYQ